MNILATTKREERKLEKQLGKLQHQFCALRAASKALGRSASNELTGVKKRVMSATARATLKNVPVLTRDLGVDPLDQVCGNLGQSLLIQFRSFTIDFSRMRFSVGENSH